MSHSPLDDTGGAAAGEYFSAIERWARLIENGQSHSGRERNCVFLNTGGPRFANASSASGLDFRDDGRGVAVVDWDRDGDLDLWLANRTGPQLRLMRNDSGSGNHFLDVRLRGRTANRDGIGSRVELEIEGRPGRRLVRTLRAGEGFLSQSSKTLHFGLGGEADIERLVVRWPGGRRETFGGVAADAGWLLVQGSGVAQPWPRPPSPAPLRAQPAEPAAPTGRARIRLAERVPAPVLRYDDFDGRVRVSSASGGPLLINLWASWCAPCVAELRQLGARRDELEAKGLSVLALSVDGLGDERGADPGGPRKLLEEVGYRSAAGIARSETVDKLELLYWQLFGRRLSFPVPTSFLLDAEGRLAAIYLGAAELDRVLEDARELGTRKDRRDLAAPFPGRWYKPARPSDLSLLAREYLRAGYAEDAVPLFRAMLEREPSEAATHHDLGAALELSGDGKSAEREYREALRIDPGFMKSHRNLGLLLAESGRLDEAVAHFGEALRVAPDAVAHLGLGLVAAGQGRPAEAAGHFREALRLRPGWPRAAGSLARLLATCADREVRDPQGAVRLAEEANRDTGGRRPDMLDTLAAAYASAGRFEEAIATGRKAFAEATSGGDSALAGKIRARIRLYESGRAIREP